MAKSFKFKSLQKLTCRTFLNSKNILNIKIQNLEYDIWISENIDFIENKIIYFSSINSYNLKFELLYWENYDTESLVRWLSMLIKTWISLAHQNF